MKIPERSYLLFPKASSETVLSKVSGGFTHYEGINSDILIGSSLKCIFKNIGENHYFFIGDFYDPDNPSNTNLEVVESLFDNPDTFDHVMEKTYSLFGKWLIIEDSKDKLQIMGDACCTKSIKYHSSLPYVSDLASLVAYLSESKCVFDLKNEDKDYYDFVVNAYKKTNWWCGNATAYKEVLSLLPNHKYIYYYENNELTVKRWIISYPSKGTAQEYYENTINRSTSLLTGFFHSLKNRGEFALTLTGGKDSRLLFAACHSAGIDAHYFVSIHGDKTEKTQDIVIPQKLTEKLGIKFNVFHTKTFEDIVKQIVQYFPEISANQYAQYNYASNFTNKSKEFKIVLGLIPEIITRYYHRRLFFVSASGLSDIARHTNSDFAIKCYQSWLDYSLKEKLPKGYSILDLFYWEHRAGRWAIQSINVGDLYQDAIHGYNCREFYDINMRIDPKIRQYPRRKYIEILTSFYGNLYLEVPYGCSDKFSGRLIDKIQELGFGMPFRQAEYLYRRIKHRIWE